MPTEPSKDAQLSDICLATSAAPTYLPAHYFQNGDREFNLIDGGIAANNPVMNNLQLSFDVDSPWKKHNFLVHMNTTFH